MLKGPTTYLKTPTSNLTLRDLRMIAKETISYCKNTLGTHKNKRVPPVSIIKRGRSLVYGLYDYRGNVIVVNRAHSKTVKMIIRTIIHEYTHYLQNMREYNKLYKKVGYEKHPYEISARDNEKLYSDCWKQIKKKI